MKETELFKPVKKLFEKMGYSVNGEVADMDVTAVRGEEFVAIELKKSINLKLLMQATKRQKITDNVYVAIPRPNSKKKYSKNFKDKEHLLKRLSVGLILVALDSPVPYAQIAFEPKPPKRDTGVRTNKKKRAMDEIKKRKRNYNKGGSSKQKIITSYRQNVLLIAGLLKIMGKSKPKGLRDAGGGVKTGSILRKNYYDWFTKDSDKFYMLTDKGRNEMKKHSELIEMLISPYITEDSRVIGVRKAKIGEAKLLTEITYDSKRYWDYPEVYFKERAGQLTIKKDHIRSNVVFVAEINGLTVGYYSLAGKKDINDTKEADILMQKGFWLKHIYIKPDYINIGIGKRLIRHMKNYCKEHNIERVGIIADPNAKGFFDKIEARQIKKVSSEINGTKLPLYEVSI